MATTFEVIAAARRVAQTFSAACRWSGWSDEQRQQLAAAASAVWTGRDLLLGDLDRPADRRRRAAAKEAAEAAMRINLDARPDSAPAAPTAPVAMTVREAAEALGLPRQRVAQRAARLKVGAKPGRSRTSELRLSPEDIARIAAIGRLP